MATIRIMFARGPTIYQEGPEIVATGRILQGRAAIHPLGEYSLMLLGGEADGLAWAASVALGKESGLRSLPANC